MASKSTEKANKQRIACRISAMAAAISLAFATAARIHRARARLRVRIQRILKRCGGWGSEGCDRREIIPQRRRIFTSGPEIASTKSLRMEVCLRCIIAPRSTR